MEKKRRKSNTAPPTEFISMPNLSANDVSLQKDVAASMHIENVTEEPSTVEGTVAAITNNIKKSKAAAKKSKAPAKYVLTESSEDDNGEELNDHEIGKKSTLKVVNTRTSSSRRKGNEVDTVLRAAMQKYSSARAKWMQYVLQNRRNINKVPTETIIGEYSGYEAVPLIEWVASHFEYHSLDSTIQLIIEDLGISNSFLIPPLSSTVAPSSHTTSKSSRNRSEEALNSTTVNWDDFDIYINASGPVWSLSFACGPVRTRLASTL